MNITIPEVPNISVEEIRKNQDLLLKYQNALEEWAATITETIKQENEKEKNNVVESALDEIEYWRSRSATFNTLFQQLNLP